MNYLDITLVGHLEKPYGWSWGKDGTLREWDINVEIFGFNLLSLKLLPRGAYVVILGFWWIYASRQKDGRTDSK